MPAVLTEHDQWTDLSGKPYVGGKVYYGVQGADPTVSPITIYSDRELTTPINNPQILDDFGRTTNKVWVPGRYSIRQDDLNDVQIYQELDNGETADKGITVLENVSGGNTIVATAASTITAYEDLEQYTFRTASVNTGAVTLNIDTVGAKAIVKNHNEPLVSGNFDADQNIIVSYNLTDDVFELISRKLGDAAEGTIGIDVLAPTGDGSGLTDVALPTKFRQGNVGTNNAVTPLTKYDVAGGSCRDSTDTTNIVTATTLTKQIDAVWAVGDDVGGLDAGTVAASTTYFRWRIERSDTGVVDWLWSLSATAPTMPANYDLKCRIGSTLTDGSSQIIPTIETEIAGGGVKNLIKSPPQDVTGTGSTTGSLAALSTPLGIVMDAILNIYQNKPTNCHGWVRQVDQTNDAPSATNFDTFTDGGSTRNSMTKTIPTDTSSQVRHRLDTLATTFIITTIGWIDWRND